METEVLADRPTIEARPSVGSGQVEHMRSWCAHPRSPNVRRARRKRSRPVDSFYRCRAAVCCLSQSISSPTANTQHLPPHRKTSQRPDVPRWVTCHMHHRCPPFPTPGAHAFPRTPSLPLTSRVTPPHEPHSPPAPRLPVLKGLFHRQQ